MEKRPVRPDELKFEVMRFKDWIKLRISSNDADLYVGYINPIVFKDEKELRSISRDIAKLLVEGKGLRLDMSVDASPGELEELILQKLKEGR